MKYIFFLIVLFFIPGFIYASPSPWGIALNEEEKQCAGFWGGDEYTHYALPEGWKDYYFENELKEGITVDSCLESTSSGDYNYKNCCDQIGYEYVSDNIGGDLVTSYDDYDLEEEVEEEVRKSAWNRIIYYVVGFALVSILIVVILVLYFVRRKKE